MQVPNRYKKKNKGYCACGFENFLYICFMNLLLNIIWLICGGFLICVEYIVSSLLLMITIVGIPFGFQTLKLSMLALCPFWAGNTQLSR